MEEKGAKDRGLIIALVILCVVVVALIMYMIVIRFINNWDIFVTSDDREVNCAEIERIDDTDTIVECLAHIYGNGDEDRAIEVYNNKIDQAFDSKDENRYTVLLSGLSHLYLDNELCEKAFDLLDNSRISELSTEYKLSVYENAVNVSLECNDSMRADNYYSMMNETVSNEEYTEFYDSDEITNEEIIDVEY